MAVHWESIVIELLNQLEDENHWSKSVQFKADDDEDDVNQRVINSNDDRANIYGLWFQGVYLTFISWVHPC